MSRYPGDTDVLIEIVGIEDTIRIVESCGGTYLSIPPATDKILASLANDCQVELTTYQLVRTYRISDRQAWGLNRLIGIVGIDSTRKIVLRCGGLWVRIPLLTKEFRAARDQAIRHEYDQGKVTIWQLAIKYRISDRHIVKILNREDKEPDNDPVQRQLSLFAINE